MLLFLFHLPALLAFLLAVLVVVLLFFKLRLSLPLLLEFLRYLLILSQKDLPPLRQNASVLPSALDLDYFVLLIQLRQIQLRILHVVRKGHGKLAKIIFAPAKQLIGLIALLAGFHDFSVQLNAQVLLLKAQGIIFELLLRS